MTTFYDYDMMIRKNDDVAVYLLRANAKPLPNGGYCQVYAAGDNCWVRKTNWQAKWGNGGIRYETYKTLDDALLAGIKWARRREQQDLRQSAI
jgi:hypothetical protein